MDKELAICAQVNFENFEKAVPQIKSHPFYLIAKAQLDEALSGVPVEEALNEIAERQLPTSKKEDECCGNCGSKDFAIARDMIGTRHCRKCRWSWVLK